MKWLKATVTYESGDPETAAALISDIFQGYGLKGVIVESPDTEDDLDWADGVAPEYGHYAVTGFFPEKYRELEHRVIFEDRICELKPSIIDNFKVVYSDVDEEDWAESWKRHFHPVKVTDRIVIRPSWQPYEAGEGELIIDLDPGMAFGTGTHPTTALCIKLVEHYLKKEMHFLDIGTGSGILMIVAAKLGAKMPAGIDNDPVAVDVAANNLHRNNIPATDFTLMEGNLVKTLTQPFDLIVANIIAETICGMIPDIPPLLLPGGILITSGIIIEKETMVVDKLQQYGFKILEIRQLEGWSAIAAQGTPS